MIFVLSGGTGKPYAVIGVTYPLGSTVTCTNGSKTLKAKDTSGKAIFVIPTAGTWTVKAVKGSQSASEAVSITAEGQVATVTLTYELIVYKPGDTNSGWSMRKDEGSVNFATNALTIDTSYNMGGYTYTNLRYNTPFLGGSLKTLTAIVTALSGFNTELGVVTEANKDTYKNDTPTFAAKVSINSAKTWTLDLSALTPNAKYYIVTHSYGRNLSSDEVTHPSSVKFTSIKVT